MQRFPPWFTRIITAWTLLLEKCASLCAPAKWVNRLRALYIAVLVFCTLVPLHRKLVQLHSSCFFSLIWVFRKLEVHGFSSLVVKNSIFSCNWSISFGSSCKFKYTCCFSRYVPIATLLYRVSKKSTWPFTGFGNRGLLKALCDTKLVLNECEWPQHHLHRINLVSFRVFRGPLFFKLTWLVLYLFWTRYNKTALVQMYYSINVPMP